MRIIDKNNDYYDYLQSPTDSLVFDRRNSSFLLTKEIICECIRAGRSHYKRESAYRFILVQACNTFWLFLITITDYTDDEWRKPTSYTSELLCCWKNYKIPRKLLDISIVFFDFITNRLFYKKYLDKDFDKERIQMHVSDLIACINEGRFGIEQNMTEWYNPHRKAMMDVPLLKASGIYIDPVMLFSSIEEYFSLEKTSSERRESIGLTDKDKIEMHGFDLKKSFRGKEKKCSKKY